MNKELLLKIAEKAVRLPETSMMETYAQETEVDKQHPCGAVACICGQALLMREPKKFKKLLKAGCDADWLDEGRRILELTQSQAEKLFNRLEWPVNFGEAYGFEDDRQRHPKKSAEVLKRRILHFIQTDGKE